MSTLQPPPPAGEPLYSITVRVTARRLSDERRVGEDSVATFDVSAKPDVVRIGEAAAEAARFAAAGLASPAAMLARAHGFVRDVARRPEIRRVGAVTAAALRKGADAVELGIAAAAARIVVQAPQQPSEPDETL